MHGQNRPGIIVKAVQRRGRLPVNDPVMRGLVDDIPAFGGIQHPPLPFQIIAYRGGCADHRAGAGNGLVSQFLQRPLAETCAQPFGIRGTSPERHA